ncbi:MAG: phosphoribosylformylglycinamidine cyclo-ligase [Elusimicrobia bacterium CG_4_9_14_3_um_filter_62_55]|nr:MAG: phosphoribosylformylglycinamidine cyclo-ligase [Elusimicrobia bacterium CG22_combo_CG10-13_8_21_14_all_63_91]PJA12589.1 MAG: phosphoribosylformylglycinamidine cyclo-ligase [Elusimicrobia bacterium CG_4_10_14_0_2_um_filter_63_34]PJB25164.1 MAG: phosphoribosylformylglycinamidine cyclo-ligase [Elusimicrobia bacterium CG_4_9_14_3_um_filter_62_55]
MRKRNPMAQLTYKKAGVDIDAANSLVKHLKKKAPAIGGFAGLFPLEGGRHGQCLVASTDGVGTKLRVAFQLDRHDTIGIDLVAMSVNDLICCGAKPLFFLDYFATGKLDVARSKRILDGILEGCRIAGVPLLGGETAEMPGSYPAGEYDLAGFAVGLVEKRAVIDGSKVFPGDLIVGVPSSGLHSNGYSLARKVLKKSIRKFADELLIPTRIYVSEIRDLIEGLRKRDQIILAMAHITGGGLPENLPRVLPKGVKAVIEKGSWEIPPIFEEIRGRGNVPEGEMWRTFNMGVGLALVVRPQALAAVQEMLPKARLIGKIVAGRPGVVFK